MDTKAFALVCLGALWGAPLPVEPEVQAGGTQVAPKAQDAPPSFAELKRDLTDRYGDKRRTAVRKLAELGTDEAYAAIVSALADEDAQVADEAQLRLSKARGGKTLALLLGKDALGHKSPLVRRRAAELLGRREEPTPLGALLSAAADKDPNVRRMAVWSAERLIASGQLAVDDERRQRNQWLSLLERERDGAVRGAGLFWMAAWIASGREWPDAAAQLLVAAGSRYPEERAAAAQWLARHGGEGAGAALLRLAADPDRAVRFHAIAGLVERGDRAAAGVLVERLGSEPRVRLRRKVAQGLERLSGLRGRLDPRPFVDWWNRLPEDWRAPAPAPGAAAGEVVRDATSAGWYGLPILSDCFAVLIDMSGSMWTEKNGVVPKTLVDGELRRLLESLTPEVRFNLLPYASEPTRLFERAEPADKRNVARAIEWFEGNRLRGKGNLWDALELAHGDREVDTFLVFHDGAPTGGPHWNTELFEALLAEAHRYNGVVLDVILTEGGSQKRRWRAVAEASGGLFAEVGR